MSAVRQIFSLRKKTDRPIARIRFTPEANRSSSRGEAGQSVSTSAGAIAAKPSTSISPAVSPPNPNPPKIDRAGCHRPSARTLEPRLSFSGRTFFSTTGRNAEIFSLPPSGLLRRPCQNFSRLAPIVAKRRAGVRFCFDETASSEILSSAKPS